MTRKVVCDFCGEALTIIDGVLNYVISSMDINDPKAMVVCKACVIRSAELLEIINSGSASNVNCGVQTDASECTNSIYLPKNHKLFTPTYIYNNLREYVVGQDYFLKDLSLWAYWHLKRLSMINEGVPEEKLPPKINLWAIGPTGVGKTLSFIRLSKLIDIPIIISDTTILTEAGYVGQDVEDVLRQLVVAAGGNISKAMCGMVVLDEMDKLATKQTNGRDVSGEGVQQALLKIVEGTENSVVTLSNKSNKQGANNSTIELNTQNIVFAACGAFTGLKSVMNENNSAVGFRAKQLSEDDRENVAYTLPNDCDLNEDLIRYGMIPELLGRFQMKSILQPLNYESLKRIMTEPKNSIIKMEVSRFQAEGIDLIVEESAMNIWAKAALKKKIGARGLATEISRTLRDVEFNYFATGELAEVRVYAEADGPIRIKTKKKVKA